MSTRPSDWSPLTGGDPCPGDPEAYTSVISHWLERATGAQAQANKLQGITSVDAESNRIRRVEQVAAEGQVALGNMADTFVAVRDVLDGWKTTLSELQARADEALRKAQEAHTTVVDSSAQIGTLGAIAGKQNEQDRAKVALLQQEAVVAQGIIASAQFEVDGIRAEYARESAAAVAAYVLNVEGLWTADGSASSSAGSFGSSVDDVKGTLLGDLSDERVQQLKDLAAAANNGPVEFEAFLGALSELDAGSIAEFFGEYPELARYPLGGTGNDVWDAAVSKSWWANLDADQKAALAHSASGMVGNLNGVPYSDRNVANRWLLDDLLADESLDDATHEALVQLQEAAQYQIGTDVPRFILSLDISNSRVDDGFDENNVLAVVSVGDVDLADATTVMVPGMDNSVGRSVKDLTQNAQDMYDKQRNELDRLGKKEDVATIAFLGYDTPNIESTGYVKTSTAPADYQPLLRDLRGIPNGAEEISQSVLDSDLARQGGQKLASFYDGLNVTKSSNTDIPEYGAGKTDAYNDPFVSINAHSYGTTTTAEALGLSQTSVNNAVFYGSAGLTWDAVRKANAGEWMLERDAQGQQQLSYVHSPHDWLAPTGALGGMRRDPGAIDFAQEFSDAAVIDSEGNYWYNVEHHPVNTTENSGWNWEDPGFGTQRGYWSNDSATMLFGSRRSLNDLVSQSDLVTLEPFYIERVPGVLKDDPDIVVRVPVSAWQWEHASDEERKELLQKMMASQGVSGQ